MKTNKIYTLLALGALTVSMASCELRDELRGRHNLEENEGIMELGLQTKANGETIVTKTPVDGTFDEADINPNNYTVRVINTLSGAQVEEISYANLMTQGGKLVLDEGKYTVQAFNYDGEEVNAAQRPFFRGVENFQILPGASTKVQADCSLQNIEIAVKLSDTFLNDFQDDYTVTVSNGEKGNWIFDKTNIDKKVYFKVPAAATTSLVADIKATTKKGDPILAQAIISKPEDAEGGKELKAGDSFSITLHPGSTPVTRYELSVTVDLTMTETGETISIPTENIVFKPGQGGDPTEGNITMTGLPANYTLEEAKTKAIVDFSVKKGIQNLFVTITSTNPEFTGTIQGMGLGDKFDLVNPGELEGVLTDLGLISASDPIKGKTQHTFNVTGFMEMLSLFGGGVYTFSIEVSDGTETKSGDLVVTVPAA